MRPYTVPVTLLGDCVVLGPADDPARHHELVRRAHGWQSVLAPADTRPARAAGLTRAALAQLRHAPDTAGEAMVVQRAGAVANRLPLPGPGRPVWSGVRALSDKVSFDPAGVGAAGVGAAALSRPWSGLLAPAGTLRTDAGVSTRFVVCGGPPGSAVTGWGAQDRESAVRAALRGLRLLGVSPYPVRGPQPRDAVPAAGLSEGHWLLDGALSLLSRFAVAYGELPGGAPGGGEGPVRLYRVPTLRGGWRIARPAGDGGGTWLPAEPDGSAQGGSGQGGSGQGGSGQGGSGQGGSGQGVCPWTPGADEPPCEADSTDALLGGSSGVSPRRLASDVLEFCGRRGLRVLGVRVRSDPLLGEQSVAWGPVWFG